MSTMKTVLRPLKTKEEGVTAENTLNASQETTPVGEESQAPGQKKEDEDREQNEGEAKQKKAQPINNADQQNEKAGQTTSPPEQTVHKEDVIAENTSLKPAEQEKEKVSEKRNDPVRPQPVEVPSLPPIAKPVEVVPLAPTVFTPSKKTSLWKNQSEKKKSGKRYNSPAISNHPVENVLWPAGFPDIENI